MEWIEPDQMDALIARLPQAPTCAPGGSAANTVCALARLGMPVALLGKMGRDDEAIAYKNAFALIGGHERCFKYMDTQPTGRCLSLITPDGERTMRTDLGAAKYIDVDDVSTADFQNCRHVHLEGYALHNPEFVLHVLKTAKACGADTSVDLASFEVVESVRDLLPDLLRSHVDMVFANQDEARAFAQDDDPEKGLEQLAACCPVAAVKLGAEGAWLQSGTERVRVQGVAVDTVVDTTGAGDCWAAGLLFGLMTGKTLEESGQAASMIGAATVSCLGASPDEAKWQEIRSQLNINPTL